jgi:hypothetical protein
MSGPHGHTDLKHVEDFWQLQILSQQVHTCKSVGLQKTTYVLHVMHTDSQVTWVDILAVMQGR